MSETAATSARLLRCYLLEPEGEPAIVPERE